MIRVDVAALEHLVAEQRPGQLVELLAVLGQQPGGRPARLVGEVLLLLVAQLARAVGDLAAVGGDLARGDRGPHRVVVDHRPRDLGHPVQVVGRAGGDRAEHELLRHAAGEQHGHVVDQLLAGLEVAVLLRQVERVAQRAAARHDRDLVDAVDAGQQLGAERVAGLVPGDDAALVLGQRAARLHAGHDALDGGVEVRVEQLAAVRAGGEDRGLVADVGQVGAGEAGGLAGQRGSGRRPRRAACCARARAGSPRGRRRRAARRGSGGRSGRGAAAPGRASRAGSRRRSRRGRRSCRSRPSPRAAG